MKRLAGWMAAALFAFAPAATATPVQFSAWLNGAEESPPTGSPGNGFANLWFDLGAHTLHVNVTFSGLTAGATVGHIHCCTAAPLTGNVGVAVPFVGFVTGMTAGTYDAMFDTLLDSTYSSAFLTANGGTAAGAEAALWTGLVSSEAYVNLHTANFPGGEIRGFTHELVVDNFPEPASYALLAAGLLGAFGIRRRQIARRGA